MAPVRFPLPSTRDFSSARRFLLGLWLALLATTAGSPADDSERGRGANESIRALSAELDGLSEARLLERLERARKSFHEARARRRAKEDRAGASRKEAKRHLREWVAAAAELRERRARRPERVEPLPEREFPESMPEALRAYLQKRHAIKRAERAYLHGLGELSGKEREAARKRWRRRNEERFEELRAAKKAMLEAERQPGSAEERPNARAREEERARRRESAELIRRIVAAGKGPSRRALLERLRRVRDEGRKEAEPGASGSPAAGENR